jgi:hypothetical protein
LAGAEIKGYCRLAALIDAALIATEQSIRPGLANAGGGGRTTAELGGDAAECRSTGDRSSGIQRSYAHRKIARDSSARAAATSAGRAAATALALFAHVGIVAHPILRNAQRGSRSAEPWSVAAGRRPPRTPHCIIVDGTELPALHYRHFVNPQLNSSRRFFDDNTA